MNSKEKSKDVILLIFLIILLFAVNYSFLNSALQNFLTDYEEALVIRIIDGDTLEIESGEKVRLLGIDAPEKGERYSLEAAKFLEEKVLNKTVVLELGSERYDRYGRILAYLYINGKNINIELVKNGLANVYVLDEKMRESELRNAWNKCIESNKNLCEKSTDVCAKCIELNKLDYNSQEVVFYNKCGFSCNLNGWEIRDEGRKNYFFENFWLEAGKEVKIIVGEGNDMEGILYWTGETYVWTRTGDTLFLRDEEGGLVLYNNY